ncbi:MAG: P1 family peptidase [Gemmatimonadales bacterium]
MTLQGPGYLALIFASLLTIPLDAQQRARELGVAPGIFPTGTYNAITDVTGVLVGHTTIIEGDSVRTGVTAILPHEDNPYLERVPAAMVVGNGYGKLIGLSQVNELGELETPILLTCTLCVWRAADAMVEWMLALPGMEDVRSLNAAVGETNDGWLNDIRSRPVRPEHVVAALEGATAGPVPEGSVGAGTGTIAFGWKGGIGSASRVLPSELGGWTVGILVQSNYGGVLQVLGAPVGKELNQYAFRRFVDADAGDGSIMVVVATDAPLDHRNLERLADRALFGVARTGSSASNGSGDYVIAFATHPDVRRGSARGVGQVADLANASMSALFQGVIEATEEAIYNSMFMATAVTGPRGTVEPLPLDRLRTILVEYGIVGP